MAKQIINQSLGGEEIQIVQAQHGLTKMLARAVAVYPFAVLVSVSRLELPDRGLAEIVTFDVQPEVPQRPTNDIRSIERIAVVVGSHEGAIPEVLALRSDFPKLPHTNLRPNESPKSLCIYENAEEARLTWTAARFLDDIRTWLTKTAKGILHQQGQPLEPLLLTSAHRLILPHDCIPNDRPLGYVDMFFTAIKEDGEQRLPGILLGHPKGHTTTTQDSAIYRLLYLNLEPRTHGVIYHMPTNLGEFSELLQRIGVDILPELRAALRDVTEMPKNDRPRFLVVVLCIPKRRVHTGRAEDYERWSFWILKEIPLLGVSLGLWDLHGGEIGIVVGGDKARRGEELPVQVLNTTVTFNRQMAQATSRTLEGGKLVYGLLGCGSVGSQLFMNMVRMGIGRWHLIDDDLVLPHNLARHAAIGPCVGLPKAETLSILANNTLNEPVADHFRAHLSDARLPAQDVIDALKTCDIIIDATTSIPASRVLARDLDVEARRMSCFLNPKGTDAVLLSEDSKRTIPLDALEMQYYRLVLNEESLNDHLLAPEGEIRYSNSCREFTTTIPQSNVAVLAGILTSAVIHQADCQEAGIRIWRLDPATLSVGQISTSVSPIRQVPLQDWTILWDDSLLHKLHATRAERLPLETGGVLIGCHDTIRKIIYVVDTLLSPPDSKERRTAYVRGVAGLPEALNHIQVRTGGMLTYIGEWHSHPAGSSAAASDYDMDVLGWLDDVMRPYGLPAVMAIAGDNGDYQFYLTEP